METFVGKTVSVIMSHISMVSFIHTSSVICVYVVS